MAKVYITIREYADRRKPCLMFEVGNQGLLVGSFRNQLMADIWKRVIGSGKCILVEDDSIDSIDDLIEEVSRDGE